MFTTPQQQSAIFSSPSRPRTLLSSDVEQGHILWLAPKAETLSSLRRRGQQNAQPVINLTVPAVIPDDGFYGHPILVVSRPVTTPDMIHFLPLTTFSGQRITKRFRNQYGPPNWQTYMAMSPAPDHPLLDSSQMYRTLTLENGAPMDKRGYVKISEVYSMHWRDAQPFWIRDVTQQRRAKLDVTSMQALLFATAIVGRYMPSEQYHPVRTPRQTIAQFIAITGTVASFIPVAHATPDRSAALPLNPAPVARRIPKVPVAAKRTLTNGTHPLSGRWSARSTGVDERDPLLPQYRSGRPPPDSGSERGFFAWLWEYLKRTRIGIILHFIFCCDYS